MMKGLGTAAASAAVIMLSGVGGAYAADLSTMPVKAIPVAGPGTCTNIVDFFATACQVSAYGVRFYGTIDVGGGYMTNPTPIDKLAGSALGWFPVKNSGARGSNKFTATANGLSLSNMGIQIKEDLGGGWSFVGQVEAGFNPYSFDLASSPGTVHENTGLTLLQQHLSADGGANGFFYNDLGFAGLSHPIWGTLTVGRQNDLGRDATIAYDAMGNSYATSYIGFFGATAGAGVTEDSKVTTAVKYRVNFGNWRLGLFSQIGGYDAGNASNAVYQGNIGGDWHVGPGVLSAEVVGSFTKDAVAESLSGGVSVANALGFPTTVSLTTPQALTATLSNNTAVMAVAKYTMDKLKLYAGYEWIQFAPPSDPSTSFTDITGTLICNGCLLGGLPVTIANTTYNAQHRIQQTAWVGARYSLTSTLDMAVAYYHADVSEIAGTGVKVGSPSVTDPSSLVCASNAVASGNCHGTADAASFLLDWQFAPKWDTYFTTLYAKLGGGQASGLANNSNWATSVGLRFRW